MTSEVSHKEFFGYKVHPAADVFPMMDETRFKELADDIKAHGLISKIQLFDGQIIDGRNRARACLVLGLQPDFVFIQCANPYSYAWSLNGQRRDLSDIQRGVIFLQCQKGAEAIDAAKKEAEERRRAAIAEERSKRVDVPNPQGIGGKSNKTSDSTLLDGQNCSSHLTKHRQRNHDNRSSSIAAKSAGITPATMSSLRGQPQGCLGGGDGRAGGMNKRAVSGHRLGAWHGRAKYPAETVRQALALHGQGLGCKRIGAELGIPWRTVSDWLSGATRWVDAL